MQKIFLKEERTCYGLISGDNERKTLLLNAIPGNNRLFVFENMTGAQFLDLTMEICHITDWYACCGICHRGTSGISIKTPSAA